MTCLLYIFIVTNVFLIYSAEDCGSTDPNVKVCKSECCPQPEDQPSTCPGTCTKDANSDCSIMDLRAPNGTCIRNRDCPAIPCGENEVFDSCPVCSEDCDNASPDGRRCRSVGRIAIGRIILICRPACRCVENYWRDENKECVYYTDCPLFQKCS